VGPEGERMGAGVRGATRSGRPGRTAGAENGEMARGPMARGEELCLAGGPAPVQQIEPPSLPGVLQAKILDLAIEVHDFIRDINVRF
jgi:hypothetical protein